MDGVRNMVTSIFSYCINKNVYFYVESPINLPLYIITFYFILGEQGAFYPLVIIFGGAKLLFGNETALYKPDPLTDADV